MAAAFTSLDELGDGYGFRKVRQALGVTAFGVNVVVMPPGMEGFLHRHEQQDELYFVHSGHARFEAGDEVRVLGPGDIVHVEAAMHRRMSNSGDDDLVVLIVGGKDGYVGRDGQLVHPERDLERRKALSEGRAVPPAST